MNKQPRPHVSRAILHLRRSISVVSLVLALALIGQVLGWGIVHFTEARFADLSHEAIEPPDAVHEPVVVVNNEKPKQVASMTPSEARPEPADVNRVEGRAAEMLKGFLNLTQTVGIIMSITLVVLMLQAVSVAGGASIPGVEMAVTATTWAIILALLCVPMSMIIPEAQYPGVFVSYQTIADASEAYRTHAPNAPGFVGFWVRFAILPLVLIVGLTALVLRFRAGVNAGIIITSVSELEERLEREMRSRKVGHLTAPRAVGALNQVIGETGGLSAPPPSQYDAPLRPTGTDDGGGGGAQSPQRRIRPI
ncbi:MAG: hypothetical protein KDA16_04660 [Phycisphaerales bacterium]|nr:hypothetical protein [Phycisphaerales bacterium]